MNVADEQGTRFPATCWTSPNKGHNLPVGVFEADASLLELISIFQFGHLLGVDRWFSHGLLGKKRWPSAVAWADSLQG